MEEIKPEYLTLFNAITTAERQLVEILTSLIMAQQLAEELYINEGEPS